MNGHDWFGFSDLIGACPLLASPPPAPAVHRDIVTLTNLPALLPNDPRQRMLQQHRLPREMLDVEDPEDDDQVSCPPCHPRPHQIIATNQGSLLFRGPAG